MSDDMTARDDAFEDARRRWEQATGRVEHSDAPDTDASDMPAQDSDDTASPFNKASFARTYRDGGVRGWLRHTQTAGDAFSAWMDDEAAQQQFRESQRSRSASNAHRQSTTRGRRVTVVLVIVIVVFTLGMLVKDQVNYMRGECVWASWEEYDRDDGYVTKLRCIDVDSPVLQDPDFRDIAKLRGNVPPLEK